MDLGEIQPNMYIIGSDGECVGTVVLFDGRKIMFNEATHPGAPCRSIDLKLAHSVSHDRVILFPTAGEVLNASPIPPAVRHERGQLT